jgi:hypothetical protein
MKFTDFDFSLTKTDNNATLYFKNDHSDDLYLCMDSVFSKYIDQAPASWDNIMDRMRYALVEEPDGVDAQLSIIYMFDDTMKIVLTLRLADNVLNLEFWAKDIENCLD